MSGQLSDALHALHAGGARQTIIPAKTPNLAAAALYYVEKLRWPVFPLRPAGKTPLTTHGLHDATLDPQQVRAWWTQWPTANIGVPTGPAPQGCGLDVIDADGVEGVAAWIELKHRNCVDCSREAFCGTDGGFHIVAEALTPGNSTVGRTNGRHVFVPASGRGNGARINGKPLDSRGAGGYVVVVPSLNLAGDSYSWITPPKVPS